MGSAANENDAPDVNERVVDTAAEFVQDTAATASNRKPALSRRLRLAKLARTHALVFLAALSAFAAADSWSASSGLAIAGLLSIVTGALAGLTIATLIHEWFHYLGARQSGARYGIPSRQGLFLYDWDYSSNNVQQFLTMSVAGTIGGFFAVVLLWTSVPADTWGRAALRGGAIAGVVFAACIEWPVIRRTRRGADPLAELSKIDQRVLSRSFMVASVAGVVMTLIFVP